MTSELVLISGCHPFFKFCDQVTRFTNSVDIVTLIAQWFYCTLYILRGKSFAIRPEFFYLLIYKPSYCNFPESRKKPNISKIIFLFYLPTLNINCLVEKNIFFF